MFRVKIFKAHMDFIIWFYGTLEATFCQVWYKMIYHLIEMMINSLTNRLQINREKEWWAYFSNLAGYFSSIKSLLQGDFATIFQLVSRLNQTYTFLLISKLSSVFRLTTGCPGSKFATSDAYILVNFWVRWKIPSSMKVWKVYIFS